ncbi:PIN domain-containing protein [Nocardioides sp.]|uniref:type II toxin-antitoxin system VapC family toxin n=1 Tax=Nocardioides sp. TaxID=35761 RepID=UPI00261E1E06|nr:PIN domain-containing protein [Nocardioides sp.]
MILCDTGPIVAAAFAHQDRHHACTEMFTGFRLANQSLLLPATVAAEVGFLLERYGGAAYEARWLAAVAQGDFEPVDLVAADYERMSELVDRYADFPLGTTDASLIALSERLDIAEIATLDRRHFTAVRPRHAPHLTLLPEDLSPRR